jgi:hypothetical protein
MLQKSRPRTSRTDHKPPCVLPTVDLATGRMPPLDISDYEVWKAEPHLAIFPVATAMIAQERERRSRSREPRASHQCMVPVKQARRIFLVKPPPPPKMSQHMSSTPTCGGNDAAAAALALLDRPSRATRASDHMGSTQPSNSISSNEPPANQRQMGTHYASATTRSVVSTPADRPCGLNVVNHRVGASPHPSEGVLPRGAVPQTHHPAHTSSREAPRIRRVLTLSRVVRAARAARRRGKEPPCGPLEASPASIGPRILDAANYRPWPSMRVNAQCAIAPHRLPSALVRQASVPRTKVRRALTVANAVRAAHAAHTCNESEILGLLQVSYERLSRGPSSRI